MNARGKLLTQVLSCPKGRLPLASQWLGWKPASAACLVMSVLGHSRQGQGRCWVASLFLEVGL